MNDQAQSSVIERDELEDFGLALLNANEITQTDRASRVASRVLLLAHADDVLTAPIIYLTDPNYELLHAPITDAFDSIAASPPGVALIELRRGEPHENSAIKLARRLRAEPTTFAVPLVFLFDEDHPTLRDLSLRAGADDYFSLRTPPNEMRARLDAILWRAEAQRRRAPHAGDGRPEVDNLIFLIDWAHESARTSNGLDTVVIVEITPHAGDTGQARRDRAIAEAYGFLKLRLRRMDSVAFYGPSTLLVYLPGTNTDAAQTLLTRLRDEFLVERPVRDIAIGMAALPANGTDIEKLLDDAEAAMAQARAQKSQFQVGASKAGGKTAQIFAADPSSTNTAAPEDDRAHGKSETETEFRVGEATASEFATSRLAQEANNPSDDFHSRAARPVSARTSSSMSPLRSEETVGSQTPRRLLLAVSDPARLARVNALVQRAGYEVRPAFDGQQALDLLRIERPDLLLIDYGLHDMNGVEALRRLRLQSGGKFESPVVLMLEREKEDAREEALALGQQVVVTPPDDPAELLASVRATENIN